MTLHRPAENFFILHESEEPTEGRKIEPSEGRETARSPVVALLSSNACRRPLHTWLSDLCLFSRQEAALRACGTAPPPARMPWTWHTQPGKGEAECWSICGPRFPVGIKDCSRRLGGEDGGSRRETPTAAAGGWGHCSAVGSCGCELSALPDGLLEAMVGAEADTGCQPLLSSAGKCSTHGAEGRR